MNSILQFILIFTIICGCHTTKNEQIKNNNNSDDIKQNKTKRTISDQIYNYGGGDGKSIILYAPADNVAASNEFTNVPKAFAFIPAPTSAIKTTVFDTEVPKHVAAQQVLYEYQQTPTNAVSNVHVNQYLQPVSQASYKHPSEIMNNYHHNHHSPHQQQGIANNVDAGLSGMSQNQQASGSENFATPAQHSSLIHHGQNFALVQFPQAPTHTQTQHYVPGKYLYVNGKIVHQPNQILSTGHVNQNVRPVTFQHQQYPQQQSQQLVPRKPYNYFGFAPQFTLKPKVNLPLSLPISSQPQRPILNSYNANFNPPQKQHLQQITKPISSPAPVVKQAEVTERPSFNDNKDDDDDDNKSSYNKENDETEEDDDENGEISSDYHRDNNDDDDEERGFFNKYAFGEDEDDEDHKKYREDDPIDEGYDEDDNSRDSSKQIISQKKLKKNKPTKYSKSSSYKYIDNYGNKYNVKPKKKSLKHKGKEPTKMHYKTIKYSKHYNNKNNNKLKGEGIEGKQSEHVPVIHKQKFVQHKWFVSKVDNSDP